MGFELRAVAEIDLASARYPTLAESMQCQHCAAGDIVWRPTYDPQPGNFVCPACRRRRAIAHSATPALRTAIGERDRWICHRCTLPVDRSVSWPHPLAGVADHWPITRAHGGRTIPANLVIAHSMCNGGPPLSIDHLVSTLSDEQRDLLTRIQDRWPQVQASHRAHSRLGCAQGSRDLEEGH